MEKEMKQLSVFILGTTGVGKTKLSLEICKRFNGEVISCDSKQLYKHADIMTAKATNEQQSVCPHNLIDCLELEEDSFNRNKFYSMVREQAQRVWEKNKVPVFIGGTNYYIEPILFQVEGFSPITERKSQASTNLEKGFSKKDETKGQKIDSQKFAEISNLSVQEKYKILCEVDPDISRKLHKNDEVRITSFLERYYESGEKPSESYKPYSYELNNPSTVVFWIRNSDKEEHKNTVSKRIGDMLNKQGICEILSVFAYLDINTRQKQLKTNCSQCSEKELLEKRLTSSGVGQSIGYKEFFDLYLCFKEKLLTLSEKDSNKSLIVLREIFNKKTEGSEKSYLHVYKLVEQSYQKATETELISEKKLSAAKEELERNTWAYCKRQLVWIRNRIYRNNPTLLRHFYILQLSEQIHQPNGLNQPLMERFDSQVKNRAFGIIESLLTDGPETTFNKYQKDEQQFSSETNGAQSLKEWKKYKCEVCEMELNGNHEWEEHLASRRHQKRLKYLEKKEEIEKWKAYRLQKENQQKQNQMLQKPSLNQQKVQQQISGNSSKKIKLNDDVSSHSQ